MSVPDPQRWALLSPLLDELLELDDAAAGRRLRALRASDATLAAEPETLLAQRGPIAAEGFLDGIALEPPTEPAAEPAQGGRVVGAYTLESALGSGGMGSVWRARRSDGRFDAVVAVKLPHANVLARGGHERFGRETQLLARLAHPHIAALRDAGVTPDGQPYLVLEYVEGRAIDRWCDARRLPVRARVRLFLDGLSAVAHAHNQLVLHCDLKPGNIFVSPAGRVMLLDFGIATLLAPDEPGANATTRWSSSCCCAATTSSWCC